LTQQSSIIHSDNFWLHHAKLGVQSQKLGVQLHPLLHNVEPPLPKS